ncbi:MAG: AAA family ATPase [Bacteroidetes bacterium]|nr:AAA family ATPase [Bacteroidota bacterium]
MDSDQIFIPRPDIKDQFDRVLARCANEGLQILWLQGDSGQGKTYFLRNYLEQARQQVLVSYAHCSSPLGNQSTNILKPYQPLKDLFEDLLANQANSRRKLNLIKNISLTVLAIIPIVGELAYGVKEIRRDLNEFKKGHREVDFSNFVREYLQDLRAIAEETPVILVVDDVQWADLPTIEALHKLFAEAEYRNARLMVVLSSRRDELQAMPELLSVYTQFSQERFSTDVALPPFDSGQIRDFFHSRFPQCPQQPDLMLWLEQKSGGNPFFLQSYIQHLLIENLLDVRGRVTGDIESYRGLPAEIRLVTNWLMKALEESDLTLLLTASVLGYQFSLHELMHLTQRSSLELIRGLRRIKVSHGIVEPIGFRLINGKESTVYHFTQHAVHTALYNELTAEEKEALHRMTAFYLNDLRLAHRDDSDVQNSVASALMLHSRLGHEPELEYQSILMKAQNTAEDLDEAEIMKELRQLSPALGLPIEQIMETYRQATQLAPFKTHHAARESMVLSLPQEEREGETLSTLISRVIAMLQRNNPAEANVLLEMHINRGERRGQLMHPLVYILFALTSEMLGRSTEHAMRSLRAASISSAHPTYAAFARLGQALFVPDDDTHVLEALKEAAAYHGRHREVIHTLTAWIIKTRFSQREEFASILASHPITPHLTDTLQQQYPKTAAVLRKRN